MKTWTAFVQVSAESTAKALGDAMEALDPEPTGVGVFELEDGSGLWEVGGYFTEAPDEIALALLSAAHGAAAHRCFAAPISATNSGLISKTP